MRWDREKLPKLDLHVYGENGTKIMVYDIKRCPKKRGTVWGAFSGRIGLPPAVTGWAASCDGGP